MIAFYNAIVGNIICVVYDRKHVDINLAISMEN